jgi:hypothetical protein
VGSRALGMGEAFTAVGGDVNSLYLQSCRLGSRNTPNFRVFHQELILDSRLENMTLACLCRWATSVIPQPVLGASLRQN